MKNIKTIFTLLFFLCTLPASFAEYRCALLDERSSNEIASRMRDAVCEFLKTNTIPNFDIHGWDGGTVLNWSHNTNHLDPFHMSLNLDYDSNDPVHQKYSADFSQAIKKVHFPLKEITVFGGYLGVSLDSWVKKEGVELESYERSALDFFIPPKRLHVSLIKISANDADKKNIMMNELYELNFKKILRNDLKNLIIADKNCSLDYCNSQTVGDINYFELEKKAHDIKNKILALTKIKAFKSEAIFMENLLKDGLKKEKQLDGFDLDSLDLNEVLVVFIKRMFFQMNFNKKTNSFTFRSSNKKVQFRLAQGIEKDSPAVLKDFWEAFDRLIDLNAPNTVKIVKPSKFIRESQVSQTSQITNLLEVLNTHFASLMHLDFNGLEEVIA